MLTGDHIANEASGYLDHHNRVVNGLVVKQIRKKAVLCSEDTPPMYPICYRFVLTTFCIDSRFNIESSSCCNLIVVDC